MIAFASESIDNCVMLIRTVFAVAIVCALGLGAWAYHAATADADDGFLRWQDARIVDAGSRLYGAHCAGCHGTLDGTASALVADARLHGPAHDETGHSWQHPDFALFRLVRDGVAEANCLPVDPDRMPIFKDVVSDAELVAILSYIKSTWSDEIRRDHDQVNMMYRAYNKAVEDLLDIDLAKLM